MEASDYPVENVKHLRPEPETQFGISPIRPSDNHWPAQLATRLQGSSPSRLWAWGRREILASHKIGLFCSVRCPAEVMEAALAAARKFRDEGATVISGFHSPAEKQCLRILLGGKQPIVVCLARALERPRVPAAWREALNSDRLLLLSSVQKRRRPDKEDARRRNELAAALSDEVLIIHATPGGHIEKLSSLIDRWGIARRSLQAAIRSRGGE
jgi:predicted Rossmann fold nucleotide-binding protein DprA/Smf involved in DNA uptake